MKHKRKTGAIIPALESLASSAETLSIVGIGASAGGLDAIEGFLRHIPDKCGMSFVIVQHLDPTHEGLLAELLQRATPMKVIQIQDRMRIEANRVYVIPPNYDLSILNNVLHLLEPAAPRGLRLPIDFFFRSLAIDQKSRSIGVILSGMGSDGTSGLAAIKEHGGAAFVQEPSSAKYDAMPRSAIEAGLSDITAPVDELAKYVLSYHPSTATSLQTRLVLDAKAQGAIEKIFILVRSSTGHDFSQYKHSTVYRRIERRMKLHGIDEISRYVKYLQENKQEILLLFKEMLIGVTNFFRDPEAWDQLKNKIMPGLLSERTSGGTLRAWTVGCSTGEEAYSLAMIFKEMLEEIHPAQPFSLQIFATDLNKDAIQRARRSLYPLNIEDDVSSERLSRFFHREPEGFRVVHEIRETVVFASQNVTMDPPFTKIDILSCRNLLIYLSAELQKNLLPLFHYSLNPGGILFLGSSETPGTSADLFETKDLKSRIYRRRDTSLRNFPIVFPASHPAPKLAAEKPIGQETPIRNLQTLADRYLLSRFLPTAVMTNNQGDILYINGRTGRYLEPAAGKANWNIHVMAREELRYELSDVFQKAVHNGHNAERIRARLKNDAATELVEISAEQLTEPSELRGLVMVVFSDVNISSVGKRNDKKLPVSGEKARELIQAREEILKIRKEMQISQEELKSANEELQSTNEELQSMNEELTTSKEETQSLNEELQTLNQELQIKLDELSRTNDDMRNLLESTDIATLFLDDKLNVRRFTAKMSSIINLIPGDLNRPISDLASNLLYPELAENARSVLETLVIKEHAVEAIDNRWFTVRIMPYRTLDNKIDGVVITFVDITVAKTLESKLRKQVSGAGGVIE